MSRSSSEREYEIDDVAKHKIFKILTESGELPEILEERTDDIFRVCEEYADQKIKQMFEEENRNEGDRFMPCSQCKKEFEWNGKDKGELIRVRGGGMWCRSCLGGPYKV